ncbi:MAG: NAD(P)/FAD-dependent oxidoreductase [Deltaproteobacteria bacterium]|nr:NAD(P)/FAD-dependent oxidoreductase [Deltaproteobacteria bacterium]MBW2361142.1 NAD(P)/FAD-dependent oxidoreductase [Deltaproteobacteria bacterium]
MATENDDSTQTASEAGGPGYDADALREKYREEREKRLRNDANEQYIEVKGAYAHFVEDPHAESSISREPLTDEVEVAVIGGGFGGLLVGAELRDQGVEDIRFIDSAGDFGGTWYWNRYPGVACDIESYIYLPLLEETDYMPKQKYVTGAEILEHCQRIAKKYDLYRNTCFQTKVTEVRWDEDASRWIITTDRGDRMKAHFVCMAIGVLNQPKLPGIPGIEDFKGHAFHASRWDYDYTGGDSDGNLTGLKGKRVGIIGTGATAVQCVPHVGEAAEHLYVFQRTPSSIDVKKNDLTDPEWAKSLQPGWHRERMENFKLLTAGGFQAEDLVNDGWTDVIRKLLAEFQQGGDSDTSPEALAKIMELADFEKMEQIRARVDSLVDDPETAEALKPYYRQFCKRPCFHNEYLPTFNRDNVTLVETQGKGVERVTEKGVVVDGREYELDCLIYASGFEVGTSYPRRAGYETVGRGGQKLTDKWADGVRTLHGMQAHGFPNCFFIVSIVQSGFTVNFTHGLGESGTHIGFIIKRAIEQGIQSLEVTAEAEAEWVDAVIRLSNTTGDFQTTCTPSYYNNEGQPGPESSQNGFFFGGPGEFAEILEEVRAGGGMKGLELR